MKNLSVHQGAGKLLIVLIATGIWLLAEPRPATAQPGWSGVVTDVSQPAAGKSTSALDLALDPQGNATAVWVQEVRVIGFRLGVVQAARFTLATDAWTAPSVLTNPDQFGEVEVATDAAGNALAAWLRPGTVEAARYSIAQGTWSPPHTLSAPGQATGGPVIAMDPSGNGIAAWTTSSGVRAARYTAATASWGAPVDLITSVSAPGPSELGLVMDAAGDAVAVFRVSVVVYALHYRASTDTWSNPTPVSAAGDSPVLVRVAANDQGDALAIWQTFAPSGGISAARFVKASGMWMAPVPLSPGDGTSFSPDVAVDRSGDAFVTWRRATAGEWYVEAIRYSAADDTWGSVDILTSGQTYSFTEAPLATDGARNAIVLWGHDGQFFDLQFSRYSAATGAWSPAASVPGNPTTSRNWNHTIDFDAGGNAVALWTSDVSFGGTGQQAARWVAGTPEAPTITGVAPGTGTLAVHVDLPAVPAFPATNLEYSLDDGRTWTARTHPSTASPVVIDGLTDFSAYTLRVRGSNAEGVGVPSPAIAATAGPVPGPPLGLTTTALAGNSVTIAWTPPPAGATPATGYVLEGGVLPGQVLASIPTGSLAPTFTFVAPTGAFFIRVHAVSGAVRSAPSNEIRIFVEVPAGPSAPTNLLGLVNGSSLTLSWTNTFGGGSPANLWLNVTGAITTVLPLPMGDTFSYDGVPPGTYTLSVAASNASGVGPFSNPVTLTFPAPCSGVPEVPVNFQAWRIGTTIFVSWRPPTSGPAVTSYTVQVSGAYVGSFTIGGRTLSGVAAPGSYGLSVTASNACGTGPATHARTVVVP